MISLKYGILKRAAAFFCCVALLGASACKKSDNSSTVSYGISSETQITHEISGTGQASSEAEVTEDSACSSSDASQHGGSRSESESKESEEISGLPAQSGAQQDTSAGAEAAGIDGIISGMTLHEKICQMLILSPELLTGSSEVTSAGEATRLALQRLPVGGIIYGAQNLITKDQVRAMLKSTQDYSALPLIMTCDEEGGRVNRLMSTVGTTYIGAMFDYRDKGPETAYKNALTIASDMRALGFNTDLAPVADVWSNPGNTVIGDRAYSDSFSQAASLIPSAVRGFHDGGVGTALKHFPGHGDTLADSHNSSVYVSKTLEQLRQSEFLPFKAGIDAGSDMVMIGHLTLTEIDEQPAPFSYRIVTEILRGELGFSGVVITDGLQMKAMTSFYTSGEIAVKAVSAGVDSLLCPSDPQEAVTALKDAVASGTVSEQRIDQSVRRILTLKLNRGILTTG